MTASSTSAPAGVEPPNPAVISTSTSLPEAAAPVADAVSAPVPGSLRSRIIQGSVVTAAGVGGAVALRFLSSMVLTRLLSPEIYGLNRLANVFLEGLANFTAVGSSAAVTRHERGDDRVFLNTAWTLQSVRGVGLWALASLFAIPYALIYKQPILWFLVPVVGLTVLLDGFDSIAIQWSQRHMHLTRITALEFLRQLTTVLVTISFAMVSPTVWAFPAGAITGCIVVLVLSHVAIPGPASRFQWEGESARIMVHFGRWIFVSSILEFVARQSDTFLLGYCGGIATVGVYGLAGSLAEIGATLSMRLSRQVIYPTLSRALRERPHELSRVLYRLRLGLELTALPALGIAMMAGSPIIRFIFPHKFWDAGWIFEILCLRTAMKFLYDPLSVCCVAMDETRAVAEGLVVRMVWVLITLPLGWWGWGLPGVVWAVAFSESPTLAVLYWRLGRRGIIQIHRETIPPLLLGMGCLIGLSLKWLLP